MARLGALFKRATTEQQAIVARAGEEAELRVARLIMAAGLDWVLSARVTGRGSWEDQHGIDVIVHTTDIGNIFLQVKCSPKSGQKFRRKRVLEGLPYITCIAARPDRDDSDLMISIIQELEHMRQNTEPQLEVE